MELTSIGAPFARTCIHACIRRDLAAPFLLIVSWMLHHICPTTDDVITGNVDAQGAALSDVPGGFGPNWHTRLRPLFVDYPERGHSSFDIRSMTTKSDSSSGRIIHESCHERVLCTAANSRLSVVQSAAGKAKYLRSSWSNESLILERGLYGSFLRIRRSRMSARTRRNASQSRVTPTTE